MRRPGLLRLRAPDGVPGGPGDLERRLGEALRRLEKTRLDLQAAQAQLMQADKMRALGQMAAGAAHEIKHPANYVAANLDRLEARLKAVHGLLEEYAALPLPADPARLAALQAAQAEAGLDSLWPDLEALLAESRAGLDRIRQIVADLRNFSRLDEAEMKAADLNAGLQSTLRIVRPVCPPTVEIVEQYADLPPVPCHPGQINQVFLNLLMNAVDAVGQSGEIRVSTAVSRGQAIVTIQDSGVGMDEPTLTRLGEPFFTTKPGPAGTGLGLSVSYGIIQRHGGVMRFASLPTGGTTAIVELPLARDANATEA